MKAANNRAKQSERSLSRPVRGSRVETAVSCTLALAALLAMVVAAERGSAPVGQERSQALAKSVRYVRSGQLAADARTLAAMVQYIMQPERSLASNENQPAIAPQDLAIRTNNAAGGPRA